MVDKQSQESIPGAIVVLLGSDPLKTSLSDADGKFKITGVLPAGYELKITYAGYKEIVLPNIIVTV